MLFPGILAILIATSSNRNGSKLLGMTKKKNHMAEKEEKRKKIDKLKEMFMEILG